MPLNLEQRLEILFSQTKFCPVCGGSIRPITDNRRDKKCILQCGTMYFSDGDCMDGVTACFQPADNLFDNYVE